MIALACGHNERELYYAGMVAIVDPPRPGVAESVEIVQSAGVRVKMVTGDALETACSIGIFRNCSVFSLRCWCSGLWHDCLKRTIMVRVPSGKTNPFTILSKVNWFWHA